MLKTKQEKIDYIRKLEDEGVTDHEIKKIIEKTFNVKKSRRNEIFREIFTGIKLEEEFISPNLSNKIDKQDKVVEYVTELSNLEDVLAEIGVDLNIWEVDHYAIETRPQKDAKDKFQFKVSFKKKSINLDVIEKVFCDAIQSHIVPKFIYNPVSKDRDCLYVLNIQDLHLSKLAWSKENGAKDYDLKIAKEVFLNAVESLMAKVPRNRVEEVIVICGSDFFQVDNDKSSTTAGTIVDSDSRIVKIFEEGVKLLSETVEKIAMDYKVRVVCFPGNHDANISMYAGYFLSAWFRDHKNVVVDNSPKTRKYYGYGDTLLGFLHGNEEKQKDVPLLVMRENQSTISQYKFIEVLSGHFHSEGVVENNGIKCRTASSLSSEDAWHTRKGYWGNIRVSQGLLYAKIGGIQAIYYSDPV